MYTSLFNVLHDSADDDSLPVGHSVHVDLEGIFNILVEQDYMA